MLGSTSVRRSSNSWRARSGSPWTRTISEVSAAAALIGSHTPASFMSAIRNPATSRAMPTTVNGLRRQQILVGTPGFVESGSGVEMQQLAEGVGVWPQFSCGGFGHDRHRQFPGALGRQESAASHHRNVEHGEVLRRHELVADPRLRAVGFGEGAARPAEGVRPRRCDRRDDGIGGHRLHHRVSQRLVDDLDDHRVRRAHAGVDGG